MPGRHVRACESLLAAELPLVCERRAKPQPWPLIPGQQPPTSIRHLTCLFCPGTGRGKDSSACGDEDSGTRSAARPALAQCRALSVDWAGPGSPHRLYLTLQVSLGAVRNSGCLAGQVCRGPLNTGRWAPPGKEAAKGTGRTPPAKLLHSTPTLSLPVWGNLLY